MDQAALSEIKSGLQKLSEGQEDLKGRLINNAGIGQAIGERLVQVDEKIDKIASAVGTNEQLAENTKAIKELVELMKKQKEGEHGATEKKDDGDLSAKVTALQTEVEEMKEKLKQLDSLDKKFDTLKAELNKESGHQD